MPTQTVGIRQPWTRHAGHAAETEISVAFFARASRVNRTFLYRHRDVLAQIHTAQSCVSGPAGGVVCAVSLQADLVNANEEYRRTEFARIVAAMPAEQRALLVSALSAFTQAGGEPAGHLPGLPGWH